ncbi:hypothetical protein A2641_01780 [Candidatus Nomurabacteria bacterium RIFCSPHIGHO2_01_FULL_37_25]|uniref:DoxX family protein n=1 Tax=Candidatus Nomurabacteria bacterium RIFCSPLOWO2_01_FULL_36_16 TaxID=1801767 RepID=A0A1F6WXT2_9BACT|nr:MAG: hypothetical protein A2641_01780 [Candidatus Nomurabacteria bacterium RIFCSPHIGHO2_01_FULL_37_25]OGI75001.1 MAG: hypothetical protein A3D36_00660 [Candidatus Nomurabacteria bacterium RIFCSPHIGHO2_02_FULL_36_29]OGI86707.1 MAG: hypothetical protein A3A91_03685 [Candidatus Nomurabacteria bacterium RIFCSPLOWO2_01_FULL_36_16]
MSIKNLDFKFINLSHKYFVPVARFGLFVIFFWFGFLKVIGLSPASDLVQALFEQTINFMSFNQFIVLFGLFECLIGILFIIPGLERLAIVLLFFHMVTTFMPLFILPAVTWSGFLIPTLEGQYIIKNLVIISTAIGIASNLHSKNGVK